VSDPTLPSRRRFLRTAGCGGLALAAGGLGACTVQGLTPAPIGRKVKDMSRAQKVVRFANWSLYIDTTPGHPARHSTLAEFTRSTGIMVDYSEPIMDNNQFLGEIGVQLALGRNPGYDLVVLTDWMVAEFIAKGWAAPLSPTELPNASRLLPVFRDHPLPDVRAHSLPWQGGFTGIAWNQAATHRPVTTMTDLLTAPDLHGRVGLVSDMRDVVGLIMLDMGINPRDFTDAEFTAALRVLDRSVRSGQILTVTNDYLPKLSKGEIAACVGWAGDALYQHAINPDVSFALPRSGGMLWTDNMIILAKSRHRDNALRLMDFYYQPSIAARLSADVHYICPVLGAQAAMRQVSPALADERYIFPPPQLFARSHDFKLLPPDVSASYSSQYAATLGL
jgi:spermidine/putrescine transport system substrate-binding protein